MSLRLPFGCGDADHMQLHIKECMGNLPGLRSAGLEILKLIIAVET